MAGKRGYVYFIEAPDVGRVKIGFSLSNSDQRFDALNTASPVALVRLAVMRGSRDVERQLHFKFKAHRVRGEWFTFAPEIREYIEHRAKVWEAPKPKEHEDPFVAAVRRGEPFELISMCKGEVVSRQPVTVREDRNGVLYVVE